MHAVGGATLVCSLMNQRLIDELRLVVYPIILRWRKGAVQGRKGAACVEVSWGQVVKVGLGSSDLQHVTWLTLPPQRATADLAGNFRGGTLWTRTLSRRHVSKIDEVKRLRQGIRQHRDSSLHELCWHHPSLWGLLPEKTDPPACRARMARVHARMRQVQAVA